MSYDHYCPEIPGPEGCNNFLAESCRLRQKSKLFPKCQDPCIKRKGNALSDQIETVKGDGLNFAEKRAKLNAASRRKDMLKMVGYRKTNPKITVTTMAKRIDRSVAHAYSLVKDAKLLGLM